MDIPTPPVDPKANRLKRAGLAAYIVATVASVAWGLSYDLFYDQGLGAQLGAGATGEGSTFVTVGNAGSLDWTGVKLVADESFFIRLPDLAAGDRADARMREFGNAYRIPRPRGVFFWEGVGVEPEPDFASTTFAPRRVRLVTDQGEASATLDF